MSGLVLLFLLGMPHWRKKYKAVLAVSVVCVLAFVLGCGGGGGPVSTSITLTTSNAKVPSGAAFTLTATVKSTRTLTGTVNIFQGHPPNGAGVAPPIQLVNGVATVTLTGFSNFTGAGTYEFWAQYTGDSNNLPLQTTTGVEEVLTGTTTALYVGQTGGLIHQAQITVNLQ